MGNEIKHLDDETFDEAVAAGVTLVDFHADWCGPCRMVAPIVSELAGEMNDVTIAKVDIEKAQKTTAEWQVTSVPTLIVFKDGEVVNRVVGIRDKESIRSMIEAAM